MVNRPPIWLGAGTRGARVRAPCPDGAVCFGVLHNDDPWLLGAPLVVLRALRGATGGASEWRPPLAWCQEVLRNPYPHHGGRLQLPERGPRTKGALGKFLRFAQGHNPWASCWWNHLKASAHARAMD